ncbi:MAG: DNA repair protein RecN [Clostridiaceae bacterium]|nr:DNA repair protein RecN [Clostridiaceae bacterium]
MLVQLQIENVAIIEKLIISMSKGFNVLTGETGAGKSILIDSLGALLGSRISRELIRSGANKATVEGIFLYENNEIDTLLESYGIEPQEDGTLIISRTFTEYGKNICRINGSLVTVSVLKEIGEKLVDIHGQHDNQSLLRPETHIEILDLYAGSELEKVKNEYKTVLEGYRALNKRLKSLTGEDRERERTMDMLRYQIKEIERAGIYPGEDEELEQQSRILSHAEEIISSFSKAYSWIYGDDSYEESALDKVSMSVNAIEEVENIDSQYGSICTSLREVEEKLKDISTEMRYIRDSIEYDPEVHKSIEERISLIQELKRKYGETIEEILKFLDEAKKRLDEMERSEEIIENIKKEICEKEKILHKLCEKMNGIRKEYGKKLSENITRELSELEMPKTRFEVMIESRPEDGFTEDGTDKVEFLFSPNIGENLKPLSKIASGGEMSRVMLGIKSIIADIDAIPTLVFDEIDTGVSGRAASKVGEKLKSVARNHQVICITHHAQIACLADNHYLIQKEEKAGRTLTNVEWLDQQGRENEITRLLSGEHATETARNLARELLNQVQ